MGGLVNEVGSLLGGGATNSQTTAQGAGGVPTSAILNPTTIGQAQNAYGTAQNTLQQQQALATALQGQTMQGTQSQTQLAQALQQQAAGGGPNPAQAALAANTGQNVANQAALMAGQRGASSNVGLLARQAAQQGAATQQGAVGQSATLQAQQQLAAQQQLQSLAASQVGQGTGQTNTTASSAQNEQGNLLSSINAQNNANVAQQSNINAGNIAMAQTNANNSAGAIGGLINAGGGAVSSLLGMAKGGVVGKDDKKVTSKKMPIPDHIKGIALIFHPSHFADGGTVTNIGSPTDSSPITMQQNASPLKNQAKWAFESKPSTKTQPDAITSSGMGGSGAVQTGLAGANESGGMAAQDVLTAKNGMVVPGRAKVKGDSQKNDTVPALLSAGEIVIPRHITQGDNPVEDSAKFVQALLAKHSKSSGAEEGDFKKALKMAISSRKKAA